MTLESVFSWIVCGVVVGICVRFLVPDRQFTSLQMTIVVGIGGAMLGHILYSLIPFAGPSTATAHSWAGWVVTTLGALFLVWITPCIYTRNWVN